MKQKKDKKENHSNKMKQQTCENSHEKTNQRHLRDSDHPKTGAKKL
jgi:hypothetical protein